MAEALDIFPSYYNIENCQKILDELSSDIILLPWQLLDLFAAYCDELDRDRFIRTIRNRTEYMKAKINDRYCLSIEKAKSKLKKYERHQHIKCIEWNVLQEDVIEVITIITKSAMILLPPLISIVINYLFYPRCLFCRGLRNNQNTKLPSINQIKLIQHLCPNAKRCGKCGVSVMHHWYAQKYRDDNCYPDVKGIMIEYLSDEYDEKYSNELTLICPFGGCRCCNNKIGSMHWNRLDTASIYGKYSDDDVEKEFKREIENVPCYSCPRCNPSLNNSKDYKCPHNLQRASYFESARVETKSTRRKSKRVRS